MQSFVKKEGEKAFKKSSEKNRFFYKYTKTDKQNTENINQGRQDGQKFEILVENF